MTTLATDNSRRGSPADAGGRRPHAAELPGAVDRPAESHPMAAKALVRITGDDGRLVERLRGHLLQALAGRRRAYIVRVHTLDRVGELLVSIEGSGGRLPLIFDRGVEPAYISRVVRETLDRFKI